VFYSSTTSSPSVDVSGGAHGVTCTDSSQYGSVDGAAGISAVISPLPPGPPPGAECAADPAVDKSHTGDFRQGQTGATFTISVTNEAVSPNGKSTTGTITLSDTLPTELTPTSAFGTGWSGPSGTPVAPNCQVSGQTVTCERTDSLGPGSSYPDITVVVNVTSTGDPGYVTNTATVSVTGGGAAENINTSNDSDDDEVLILSPTEARMRSFAARWSDSVAHLEWRTAYERANLGFVVYRESPDGERMAVTPSLVAGSALLAGAEFELGSGRGYRWVDKCGASCDGARYWLEDIALDGTRTLHGPVVAERADLDTGRAGLRIASTLEALGRLEPHDPVRSAPAGLGSSDGRTAVAAGTAESSDWTLGSARAAQIAVSEDGWYRVWLDDVVAAGFDPGPNYWKLQLWVDGAQVPILLPGSDSSDVVQPEYFEFYGQGLDTAFTGRRIYWLVVGEGPGLRIGSASPARLRPVDTQTSFPYTVTLKDRVVYFAALTTNGDRENFYGQVVTTAGAGHTIAVTHPADLMWGGAKVEVALQGATAGVAHAVDVEVNGTVVGSTTFFGQAYANATFNVPHSALHEGDNDITLYATGGPGDVSVVDFIRLTYEHAFVADDDALRFVAPPWRQVTVRGFSEPTVRVFDVTDPSAVRQVRASVTRFKDGYAVTVKASGREPAILLAVASTRVGEPTGIAVNQPSTWRSPANGADLVILTDATLAGAAERLRETRSGQGLATVVVDIVDLYDEFTFGHKNPVAIRDFLSYAAHSWQLPPRFALLLGDATFDPRNYLGLGDHDLVPTRFVPTSFLKAECDDWFADFDDDGLPEIAVGRLPVRTLAEADAVIDKLIAQATPDEAKTVETTKSVLLVADDGAHFEDAADDVYEIVPPALSRETIKVGDLGVNEARKATITAFETGHTLVDFLGHGSVESWGDSVFFEAADAAALLPSEQQPLVVAMTCLNGFFADVYLETLAEALLKTPAGGALAVWASSALTDLRVQNEVNRRLVELLLANPEMSIGEAVAGAKSATDSLDVRRSFNLIGDPSVSLELQ